MVQGDMVFLGGDIYKRQGQFRVAVISVRIQGMRHYIANHAVAHGLVKAIGQVIENDLSQLLHGPLSVFG